MKIGFVNQGMIGGALFLFLSGNSAFAQNLWGYCSQDKLAYSDSGLSARKPAADKICALPTADETKDAVWQNTTRCLNDQESKCTKEALAAAGKSPDGFGLNDVPQGAWYYIAGQNTTFPKVRCSCGCFAAGTSLLTELGWQKIEGLRENAMRATDRLVIPQDKNGKVFKLSDVLKPIAFTKGAEEKPVIKIKTASNLVLEMTELHPVLVQKGKDSEMVQAKTLKVGDVVFDAHGEPQKITDITTRILDVSDNNVYNVNTYGHGYDEHIIVANGIRTGDLAWQNKLAERTQRSENLIANK